MTNAPASESNESDLAQRVRYALPITVVFTIAFLGLAGLYLYLAFSTRAWQFYILAGMTTLVTLADGLAIRLIPQKRLETVASILIFGMALTFPVATLLVSGLGIVLGIGTVLPTIMIASLIMPRPTALRTPVIGVITGLGIILLEVLFPFSYLRLSAPLLQIYTPAAALVVIGIFLYFTAREYNNYTLRTKLITAFIATALVSVGVLGYFSNRSGSAQLTQDVGNSIVTQTKAYATLVGETLAKEVGSLESFGLSKVVQDRVEEANASYTGDDATIQNYLLILDKRWRAADAADNNNDSLVARVLNEGISSELKEYSATFPENVEVFVTDKYGASVASTNRTSDYYQADEGWWKAAYNDGQGAIYIGEPEYDESSSTFSSVMAVPLYAHDTRRVIGVLRTTLDLKAITSLLKKFQLGQTGQIELYVANNQRVPSEGGELVDGDPAIPSLKPNEYAQVNYNNHPSIISASPIASLDTNMTATIEALGWKIIIHQDQQESLAPVARQTQTITLISLLLLGLAGLAAYFASQIISQPVLSLADVAKRISAGDFQARAQFQTQDEIGQLANTFNAMAEDLQRFISGLEQRVAERTFDLAQATRESEQRAQELRSIAEVSSMIAGEQKLDRLLPLVANLISEKFNFYHIGLFLNDATGRYAVLQAANSQGGQRMLARNHKLEIGQSGLVGFVAQTGRARIALDVGADAVFFSNPDLPETRSEIALPLNVRSETIGVLDVQSEKAGAFSQTDIDTLNVLADQVAISIDNARLFGEAQRTLAETQALYNQFLGQQWQGFLQEEKQVGYQHTLRGGEKLNAVLETEEIEQALVKGQVVVKNPRTDSAVMVVPVRLRNQVIGVLNIKSLNQGQPWSPDEVNMVQAVSDRLALTLETARLFQEAQRRATTERAIGEVATKLATAPDIDSILRLTAEELGKLLSDSKVAIQINPTPDKKK